MYLYATSLKQTLLIGNVIVALLLSFHVVIIGIYDLYPATYEGNQKQMAVLFSILLDYAIFAFIINFIREIVKDLEDVNGDYNQGMNTLPIVLGVQRTTRVVFVLSFIPLLILLYYTNEYFAVSHLYLTMVYTFVVCCGATTLFYHQMLVGKKQKRLSSFEYHFKICAFLWNPINCCCSLQYKKSCLKKNSKTTTLFWLRVHQDANNFKDLDLDFEIRIKRSGRDLSHQT